MLQHIASTKANNIKIKSLALVIPIRSIRGKRDEPHGKTLKVNTKKEFHLFYSEPIFKAKKHDPL